MPFLLAASVFHIPILLMQITIITRKLKITQLQIAKASNRKLEKCHNTLKSKLLLCAFGQDLTKSA
jgi:hypothetical protein